MIATGSDRGCTAVSAWLNRSNRRRTLPEGAESPRSPSLWLPEDNPDATPDDDVNPDTPPDQGVCRSGEMSLHVDWRQAIAPLLGGFWRDQLTK